MGARKIAANHMVFEVLWNKNNWIADVAASISGIHRETLGQQKAEPGTGPDKLTDIPLDAAWQTLVVGGAFVAGRIEKTAAV